MKKEKRRIRGGEGEGRRTREERRGGEKVKGGKGTQRDRTRLGRRGK